MSDTMLRDSCDRRLGLELELVEMGDTPGISSQMVAIEIGVGSM